MADNPLTPSLIAATTRSHDLINQINEKCQTLVSLTTAAAEGDQELHWGAVGTLQNLSDQLDEMIMLAGIM